MAYKSADHARQTDKLRTDVNQLRIKTAFVVHQEAQNVGAGTAVANAWTTRTLNTILRDPFGIVASLASNVVTLKGGDTYRIFVSMPFARTQETLLRLWNTTYNTLEVQGQSFHFDNQNEGLATLVAIVSPSRDTGYRLDYYCKATHANGLGKPVDISGYNEIYGFMEIQRLTGLKP